VCTRWITEKRAVPILQQLIRIRTTQPYGDELDAVKYIRSLFTEKNLEFHIVDHGKNRASVVLTLPGENRNEAVAVAGHMDTLGLCGTEKWEHSPFGADFQDGNIYGRGAANMKGGITSVILALREIIEEQRRPPRDIIFCLTADGDMSGIGARVLTNNGFLQKAKAMIFAEPTDCKIGIAQKGALWLRIKVYGKRGHACLPSLGSSAFEGLLCLIQEFKKIIHRIGSHPLLGNSTLVLTQINGGEAINSVPEFVEATLDIRTLPSFSNEEILNAFDRLAKKICNKNNLLEITISVENNRPAVGMDKEAPFCIKLQKIIQSFSIEGETRGLLYFTDVNRMIPALGIPFAIIGPGKDIYSFPSDEHVSIDSVLLASKIFKKFFLLDEL